MILKRISILNYKNLEQAELEFSPKMNCFIGQNGMEMCIRDSAKFTTLLESGFTDTFRYFYPEQEGIYSWWSYRFKADVYKRKGYSFVAHI